MKKGKWLALALASSLAVGMVALFSCGGGGGGGGGGTAAVTSRGTVTKVASIEVNGITYDTSASLIEMSEDPLATETSLKDGMVVEVTGAHSGTTGVAVTVRAEEVLKGPVSAVGTFSLTALGQTVQVDAATLWDTAANSQADVIVGDFVEVHGYVVGEGVIQATRVEEKTGLLGYKVKGIVAAAPAPTATAFSIGGLGVDYATADVSDIPGGVVTAGSFVEVASAPPVFDSVNMILTATKVETDDVHGTAGEEAEVEGLLLSITGDPLAPPATLLIAGQTVELTAVTRYEGGTAAGLFVGVWIEAEGHFNASGAIVADEIKFEDSVQLEGDIAAIDGAASTVTLAGLAPIVIQIPAGAEMVGGLLFANLAVGDHLVVEGRGAGGSNVVAAKVERIAAKPDAVLQGPLDAASASPNLVILGVTVDTSPAGFQFRGKDNAVLTQAQFFGAVGTGTVVSVSGTLSGAVITWTEAEIE
jgi:hypothetical protein